MREEPALPRWRGGSLAPHSGREQSRRREDRHVRGRYRRRRFAAFQVTNDAITRKPHQPHYQSRDYNILNGGIQRRFEPIPNEVANHDLMIEFMGNCGSLFGIISPCSNLSASWHTEVHQFRIEAGEKEFGLPTPEGMHRDGVDWVCVVLINRKNVSSGVTRIFDNQRGALSEFTLTNPLDTVFLDDSRVEHGVTPISRLDPDQEGFRDILVLTFRHDRSQLFGALTSKDERPTSASGYKRTATCPRLLPKNCLHQNKEKWCRLGDSNT